MVKIKGISNEIAKILSEYTDEVIADIEVAKEVTAKETVKELKKTSPKKTGAIVKAGKLLILMVRRLSIIKNIS